MAGSLPQYVQVLLRIRGLFQPDSRNRGRLVAIEPFHEATVNRSGSRCERGRVATLPLNFAHGIALAGCPNPRQGWLALLEVTGAGLSLLLQLVGSLAFFAILSFE